MPNLLAKVVIAGLLTFATYQVVKCPCDKLMGCSSDKFYTTIGAVSIAIPAYNYFLTP